MASNLRLGRIACVVVGHQPAPVTPLPLTNGRCRCTCCGALIEWDDNGGWRYA